MVVSIVAILAMVAYPAYTDQVHKSRRSDAKQALMRASQGLERCYSRYRRFDTTDCDLVGSGPSVATTSQDGYYAISSLSPAGTETLAAETFSLFASPQGSQAGDTRCASLRMDRSGAYSATDAAGNDTTAFCW